MPTSGRRRAGATPTPARRRRRRSPRAGAARADTGAPGSERRSASPVVPPLDLRLVGGRELFQDLVALGRGGVQSFLGRLLAREDLLQLGLDHVADLRHVAETVPAAVGGGSAAQLGQRRPLLGVLLEVVSRLE